MKISKLPYGLLESNMYLVSFGKDAFVIDPSVSYSETNVSDLNIRAIFCTHGHYDHITQAQNWRQETGAPIYCHRLEQFRLQNQQENLSYQFGNPVEIKEPIHLFPDENTALGANDFNVNKEEDFLWYFIHTPGHTKGSVSILLLVRPNTSERMATVNPLPIKGSKGQNLQGDTWQHTIQMFDDLYLFTGDTVFAGTVGRVDLGGNKEDMTASLKKILLLPPTTKIFPGHGEDTTVAIEKNNNPYFKALL